MLAVYCEKASSGLNGIPAEYVGLLGVIIGSVITGIVGFGIQYYVHRRNIELEKLKTIQRVKTEKILDELFSYLGSQANYILASPLEFESDNKQADASFRREYGNIKSLLYTLDDKSLVDDFTTLMKLEGEIYSILIHKTGENVFSKIDDAEKIIARMRVKIIELI